jgi:hypothetical protein
LIAEQSRQAIASLGPYGQIVVEDDGLSVEQKALSLSRRAVDELVDQRYEPLPEDLRRLIPLPIPMGVRNEMNLEGHSGARRGWTSETAAAKDRRGRSFPQVV